MPMTYTLFETVKDFSYDGDIFQNTLVKYSFISLIFISYCVFLKVSNTSVALPSTTTTTTTPATTAPVVKKEQLTKAQKRRQWNNRIVAEDGQKPRGHDWVDIVRHLSQTGNKVEN